MHPYKLSVNHIDSDFGLGSDVERWTTKLQTEEELIVFLNRVAIATSSQGAFEHPEIEITLDSRRAVVSSIDGHLYYTELDAHKQNLRVVAEDVLNLLKGRPFQPVVMSEEVDDEPQVRHYAHQRQYSGNFRFLAWAIIGGIMFSCAFVIWKEIRYQPTLVEKPRFIEESKGTSEILKELAGFYIHELREGGMIFEIRADGQLDFYELWESKSNDGFVRLPLESHELKVGIHKGRDAYLAGEVHLLKPLEGGALEMHGLTFTRFEGKKRELGPIRKAP